MTIAVMVHSALIRGSGTHRIFNNEPARKQCKFRPVIILLRDMKVLWVCEGLKAR